MEKVQKIVMKDNNFEQLEKNLYLEEENLLKIKEISKKDAKFFETLEIMDYSLLILKLSVNDKEVITIIII